MRSTRYLRRGAGCPSTGPRTASRRARHINRGPSSAPARSRPCSSRRPCILICPCRALGYRTIRPRRIRWGPGIYMCTTQYRAAFLRPSRRRSSPPKYCPVNRSICPCRAGCRRNTRPRTCCHRQTGRTHDHASYCPATTLYNNDLWSHRPSRPRPACDLPGTRPCRHCRSTTCRCPGHVCDCAGTRPDTSRPACTEKCPSRRYHFPATSRHISNQYRRHKCPCLISCRRPSFHYRRCPSFCTSRRRGLALVLSRRSHQKSPRS
mmetsp:Transcript_10324/g.30309  ORF Transcript_10324/g.30309 Transcript_10324/m.30309 type:complete len:264 (-) Transcript_10324:1802-2593(-)